MTDQIPSNDWKDYGTVSETSFGFAQRFTITKPGEAITFSPDVASLFADLGDRQRGEPEMAMLQVQRAASGILGYVCEHVGDLYHRMTHHAKYGQLYGDLVDDKVQKCLGYLESGYGFEREVEENLEAVSRFEGRALDEVKATMDHALAVYAQKHRELPTHNQMQWLARQAAVALGEKDFEGCRQRLRTLGTYSRDPVKFANTASPVMRDKDGEFLEYNPREPAKETSYVAHA